jgi:bleomycin hydrolase
MKKITSIICLALSIGLNTSIAQDSGTIDESLLNEFRSSINSDEGIEAIQNAVSSNNIQKLALNRNNLGEVDRHFTHRVESKGITDQKSTGRCWLFTGLNVFRAKVIEENNMEEFSFSHNFNFFYDQLEKANLFLEAIISTAGKPMDDKKVEWLFKHPINDGGQWTGVADIVSKYGVVPANVFPESFNSENTRWMSRFIRRKLKEDGLILREMYTNDANEKKLRESKNTMLNDINRILAISLGEPPTEFEWRFEDKDGNLSELKTYSPISFYDEFVNIDLNDYVMFMNDPSREFDKVYEIELDRHIVEGQNWKYLNLEADKIKQFAITSIKGNEAMYFSCDVGKQLDKERGYLDVNNYDYDALFGIEFGMDKKQRIQTFESGSTHGMALVAVDLQNDKPVKWLLENSWGDSGFEGHLIMTNEWFNEYMFRIVIHKRYIDDETLKILEQDPIILPPWDPMFEPDN